MYGMVSWFAKNAVAANLLMLVAFLGGILGYSRMDQQLFPVVPVAGATVSVAWNGASPQDIEEQIITRIEEQIADMPGLKRTLSVAREGSASVNIRGREDIDMKVFVDEVKLRVDQINNLPQAAFEPQVRRWEQRNNYFGMAVHGDVDRRTLKRIADKVRDDIAALPGGELAELDGVLPEQVHVEVSEDALRRFGLSFSDVANAIRQSSVNASGGRIESAVGDVSLTTRQLADTEEQFESIIIRQSSAEGTIRVGDVAEVIDGFETENFEATYDKKPTVFVFTPAPDSMHIVNYTDGIKEYIEEANDPANGILPEGMQISILWDDSELFSARMSLIARSAATGALLVMIVLILFLRPIVAFWVTVGIVTAFAGGIMLLPYFGVSWNILSTFAVLLVIGVVVDDAIIVGENIHKEVESGRREGLDAAIVGTQLVLKPVIFGVLTTIIAFLPWAFLTGEIRSFTSQITYVVVAALVFSIIECMLILPAHLAHLKKQNFDSQTGGLMKFQRSIADSLLWFANHIYKPILELALRFRYATVALFVALFMLATSIQGNGYVPFKFFPEIDSDLIRVEIELPEGTPYTRVLQVRDQFEAGIERAKPVLNEKYPAVEDGIIRDTAVVANSRRVRAWVSLVPPQERPTRLTSKEAAETLRDYVGDIQDAEEVNFEFSFNDSQSGVRFALNHPDIDRLREGADAVKAQLATYSNTFDIGDNLSSAAEEIRVTLKPGAQTLGVTLADVTQQIRQAYFGEEVQRLPRDGEDVRVMVRLPQSDRENLDSLKLLRVRTNDGREIPIDQVADFEFVPGINVIIRRNRSRSVSVRAELKGEGGRGLIMADMTENFWPEFERKFPDIERAATGGSEEENAFLIELVTFGLTAIFAMYILLAVAFRSYSQPILLMMAIPFAYCGAVFGLLAFNTPMAMFSIFGIAAAAGVVINDNLVLVDYVNRRRDEGAGAVQALVDAGVSRFRPILLTSVTTFIGVLPLIAERSTQAQFLKPMVISLGCAVAFALFVSLLMVPALYAVGVEIGRIFSWSWNGRPYRRIGETYSGEVTIDDEELIGSSHADNPKEPGFGSPAPAE